MLNCVYISRLFTCNSANFLLMRTEKHNAIFWNQEEFLRNNSNLPLNEDLIFLLWLTSTKSCTGHKVEILNQSIITEYLAWHHHHCNQHHNRCDHSNLMAQLWLITNVNTQSYSIKFTELQVSNPLATPYQPLSNSSLPIFICNIPNVWK